MKKVIITIEGEVQCVEYCSKQHDFDDCHIVVGLTYIEDVYADDDCIEDYEEKEVTSYFKDKFAVDQPLPVVIRSQVKDFETFTYELELPDDEEFDIKKVQLIKSDYEIDVSPYFILCEKILYDGKDVEANLDYNNWTDYCPDEKMYNTLEVTDFCY